jgi:hypothetical protein
VSPADEPLRAPFAPPRPDWVHADPAEEDGLAPARGILLGVVVCGAPLLAWLVLR